MCFASVFSVPLWFVSFLPSLREEIQEWDPCTQGLRYAVFAHARVERHTQRMVNRGAEVLGPHRPILYIGRAILSDSP